MARYAILIRHTRNNWCLLGTLNTKALWIDKSRCSILRRHMADQYKPKGVTNTPWGLFFYFRFLDLALVRLANGSNLPN